MQAQAEKSLIFERNHKPQAAPNTQNYLPVATPWCSRLKAQSFLKKVGNRQKENKKTTQHSLCKIVFGGPTFSKRFFPLIEGDLHATLSIFIR